MHKLKIMALVGALLSDVPKEGEPLKIVGSTMIAQASTKEEVMDIIKKDIYSESGVWDLEKVSLATYLYRKRANAVSRSKSTP